MPLLFGDFFKFVLEFLLFSASGFIILLVLVQRGRGGGLTGALGGMGGQSAFGAKAGDVFTRITVGAAIVWILLCLLTIRSYTYVNVNTTAMKEYQYTKLLKDTSFDDESTGVPSSLDLGKNADDSPGARLDSLDSDADKKAGKQLEDDDTKDSAPGNNAPVNDDNAKKADDKSKGTDDGKDDAKKDDASNGEPKSNVDAEKSKTPETSKSATEDKKEATDSKAPTGTEEAKKEEPKKEDKAAEKSEQPK